MYTSDSSGQLAVWKITHDDKQRLYESQLIHSLNYQIGIFNITKPMLTMMKQDNHLVLSEIRKSIITVSSKGLHIAYMGPRLDMLTIAKGVSALTVKQIDLSHLILQVSFHYLIQFIIKPISALLPFEVKICLNYIRRGWSVI